jgi:MFS transporter, PAT family, beta-lactamase induction signal transducer AmpG
MREKHVHPWIFMLLIIPFGVMSGYLSVAIAYLYSKGGVSVEQIAGVLALGIVPHTWKFAWAPVVDVTLNRKAWYLIASVLSAAGIWATGILPSTVASLPMLGTIVLVSNVAVTFLGMAVDGLMAYSTTAEQKGRAGGWFQAGNLGGAGLGGGAGLWLAQHLHAPWMAGAILGGACLLCCVGLLFVDEPHYAHREGGLRKTLVNVGQDLWSVGTSRTGAMALLLCFLPLCTGAASGLWSAVADDWHASANTVALVTGVLGGLISAAGCILGGWICDRFHRMVAYAWFGVLMAACAIGMAYAPRTEWMYIIFTSVYAFITGLTYAGFSAFVLEAIGMGAAATKYNVYASLSNFPIYYMTRVDGWAHTRWGARGMLNAEAMLGLVGVVIFFAVMGILPKPRTSSVAAT